MNDIYKAVIRTKTSYLVHYNHNHDKLGRFAKSNGASSSPAVEKYKKDQERYKKENDDAWQYRKSNNKLFRKKMSMAQNKLAKAYLKLKESQDKKARDYADYVSGVNLEKTTDNKKVSDEESKNIVLDKDISKFIKDSTFKSIKGDIYVDHGQDLKSGKVDYNVVGESTSKVWKEEVRSKDGVHIIQTHPTTIDLGDVAHSSWTGIDKNKVKKLDSFVRSKQSNKSIYEGRDLVASGRPETSKGDWSPMDVSYGFDKNGNPVAKSATYIYKSFGGDADMVTVEFDEKGKPGNPWYT